MKRARIYRLLPLVLLLGTLELLGPPSAQALPPQDPPTLIAEVSRVFDAETIRALLHSGKVETIKYIGVDAPDPIPSACFGPEATLYNRDLVINRTVWLELDRQQRDGAGRLLAYVYLDPQGLTMVNAILIAQGLARAADPGANRRYDDLFGQLQEEARSAGRGLWGACASGPAPANRPPQAIFSFRPANPQPGQPVSFDGSASSDPDGRITQYSWEFGDGAGATGPSAEHSYAQAGVFTVTLTVSDDRKLSGRISQQVSVGEASAPPPAPTPPAPSPNKPVIIETIHYDAQGEDNANLNGEWLVLLAANRPVALKGWTVSDELGNRGVASHIYHFPEGFVLAAGGRVKLLSGCGTDSQAELHWCARSQIWDNGEDTVFLTDDQGKLVARCRYGDPDGSERGVSRFNCQTMKYS